MATRSTIAIEFADGTVQQVYAHWDGDLNGNGRILLNHYSNATKLQELIAHGSISSLAKDIGVKHEFNCPHPYCSIEAAEWTAKFGNMTSFHARERGQPLSIHCYEDFDDYTENHQYEEFDYILRNVNGTVSWFVAQSDCAYEELTSAIKYLAAE